MSDRHQQKPYPLRMSDELRARLEQASKDVGRSLHAEIVDRLERSFRAPSALFDPLLGTLLHEASLLEHAIDVAETELHGLQKLDNPAPRQYERLVELEDQTARLRLRLRMVRGQAEAVIRSLPLDSEPG